MKKSFVTALLVAFTIAWVAVSAMPVPVVASAGPQSSDSVVVNPASIIDEVVWGETIRRVMNNESISSQYLI